MTDDLIELLPVGPADKPVEEWTPAELLIDGARVGLMRNREIASWAVDASDGADQKRNRLIAECGQALFKTLKDVQQAQMQASDKGWDELLARIEAAKAKP